MSVIAFSVKEYGICYLERLTGTGDIWTRSKKEALLFVSETEARHALHTRGAGCFEVQFEEVDG